MRLAKSDQLRHPLNLSESVMPPKALWEAYKNHTVRLSVRPSVTNRNAAITQKLLILKANLKKKRLHRKI